MLRSTRLLSGATGTLPGSAGCGIACADVVALTAAREPAGELEPELEHALASNATGATATNSRAIGRRDRPAAITAGLR